MRFTHFCYLTSLLLNATHKDIFHIRLQIITNKLFADYLPLISSMAEIIFFHPETFHRKLIDGNLLCSNSQKLVKLNLPDGIRFTMLPVF